jgi:hypothetical protein
MPPRARVRFLNVDLDVRSREDLTPLAEALEPQVFALHVGRVGRGWMARFELSRQPTTPDAAIRRLAAAVERLPARERARWRRATRREFNVGIQAAAEPHASEFPIEPDTLALVARLKGRLVLTLYAPPVPRRPGSSHRRGTRSARR